MFPIYFYDLLRSHYSVLIQLAPFLILGLSSLLLLLLFLKKSSSSFQISILAWEKTVTLTFIQCFTKMSNL